MKKIFTGMILTYGMNVCAHDTVETKKNVAGIGKHVAYVHDIAKQHRMIPMIMVRTEGETTFNFLCQELIHYSHAMIRKCIVDVKETRSLHPFFAMWDQFVTTHSDEVYTIDDDLFLKECGTLIFTFYNNIMHELVKDEDRARVTVTEIIELYEAINALPITKLLDLLDQMLDELTRIFDDHKMQPGQSVFGWVHENWWVPPVVFGALLINILSL